MREYFKYVAGGDFDIAFANLYGKTGFLCPTAGDIKVYDDGDIYYYGGDEDLPVGIGDVDVALEPDSTYNVKIVLTGTAAKMSADVISGLGFASSTHAIPLLIMLPNVPVADILYKGAAITEADIVRQGNLMFLAYVKGVYDSTGTITEETTNPYITACGKKITYTFDVTGLDLAA